MIHFPTLRRASVHERSGTFGYSQVSGTPQQTGRGPGRAKALDTGPKRKYHNVGHVVCHIPPSQELLSESMEDMSDDRDASQQRALCMPIQHRATLANRIAQHVEPLLVGSQLPPGREPTRRFGLSRSVMWLVTHRTGWPTPQLVALVAPHQSKKEYQTLHARR